MNNSSTILNHLFSLNELPLERLSEIAKSAEFKSIKRRISDKIDAKPIPERLPELMFKEVSELLNIDLRAILLSAWCQVGEFAKYLDMREYFSCELHLAEHTITSEPFANLVLIINDSPVGQLRFTTILKLRLKDAVLKIRDGRIVQWTVPSCEVVGIVRCGDCTIMDEKWKLSDTMELGEGVPINETAENVHNKVAKMSGSQSEVDGSKVVLFAPGIR